MEEKTRETTAATIDLLAASFSNLHSCWFFSSRRCHPPIPILLTTRWLTYWWSQHCCSTTNGKIPKQKQEKPSPWDLCFVFVFKPTRWLRCVWPKHPHTSLRLGNNKSPIIFFYYMSGTRDPVIIRLNKQTTKKIKHRNNGLAKKQTLPLIGKDATQLRSLRFRENTRRLLPAKIPQLFSFSSCQVFS